MKVAIVYRSIRGNTKIIAEAISKIMGADLFDLDKVKRISLDGYDLIGFGSGIYYGKHHRDLLEFVDMLPHLEKEAFIFSTSAFRRIPLLDFDKALKKRLKKKGFRVIASFSCRGYTNYLFFSLFGGIWKGRPNHADIGKAEEFAKNVLRIASYHQAGVSK